MKAALLISALALALTGCGCDENDAACLQAAAQRKAQSQVAQFVDVPSTAAVLRAPVAVPQAAPAAAPAPVMRFTLARAQIVKDELAYGRERGVYILKDNETGREYIGVSGIGITEIGRHNCGKGCTKEHEQ
jgi:hypothetical protein